MKIEVWSDVACPFCYIGKHKLENAISELGLKDAVSVEWKSYQLDPEARNEHMNAVDYLSSRKGIPADRVKQMMENVKQMAADTGLVMFPEKAIVANTFNAHRLTHLSILNGKQNEAEELLFEAHFKLGKNINDENVLREIGSKIGFTNERLDDLFSTNIMSDEVREDIHEASELGVRGVPFFVFNRKYAISGAQDISVFKNTLQKAMEE